MYVQCLALALLPVYEGRARKICYCYGCYLLRPVNSGIADVTRVVQFIIRVYAPKTDNIINFTLFLLGSLLRSVLFSFVLI